MPFSAKIGFFEQQTAPTPPATPYDWPGYMTSAEFTSEVDGDFTNVGPATYGSVSPGFNTGHRYAVLADNGNVYMMPRGQTYFIEFEPSSNTSTQISSPASSNEYTGGALASTGNVYCPAFGGSSTMLELEPSTGTTTEITPTGDYNTTNIGGVTLPSGNVMFMPRSSSGWFTVYDPATNTATKAGATTTVKTLSENFEYVGGVSSTNGKVYWMPFNGQEVSYYDEATDTWTDVDVSSIVTNNSNAFQGGVLMTDGRIVGVPYSFNELFVFDPSDDSFYSDNYGITTMTFSQKFIGGGLAPNGNVYFANFNWGSSNQIEFDTQANVAVHRTGVTNNRTGCIGVVPTGDDRVLFVANSGSTFTQVITGKTPTNAEVLKSPQLNRGG